MQEKIRTGYKQTEIGVIPEDWSVALARDVLLINRGRVISHRELAKHSGPYPVYSSQTRDNGVMGYLDTFDFEGAYLTWTTDGANAGTVFFRNGKFNCTNVCGAGKARVASQTSAAFYAYFLNTVAWKHVSHVGNPKLMSGPFGGIPVVVPPPAEQRAIAEAISDADARNAALEALIAKNRDLKQAAMQQLLTGKIRLPGFSNEWEVKRLGEVAAIRNQKISTLGADVAAFCVELEQVGQNNGQIDGHSDARGRRSVKYQFQRGDVLFGRLRPYLRKFWWANREGVCSTEIWPLTPIGGRLAAGFLNQIVQTDAFIEAANSSYGTHMPRSDWSALAKLEICLPTDHAEQSAIVEILSDMDTQLAALDAEAEKAGTIKQGMMQNLLTGKVRLV